MKGLVVRAKDNVNQENLAVAVSEPAYPSNGHPRYVCVLFMQGERAGKFLDVPVDELKCALGLKEDEKHVLKNIRRGLGLTCW